MDIWAIVESLHSENESGQRFQWSPDFSSRRLKPVSLTIYRAGSRPVAPPFPLIRSGSASGPTQLNTIRIVFNLRDPGVLRSKRRPVAPLLRAWCRNLHRHAPREVALDCTNRPIHCASTARARRGMAVDTRNRCRISGLTTAPAIAPSHHLQPACRASGARPLHIPVRP